MNIKDYLDSTYLKTAEQAGISENENIKTVVNCVQEAIDERFKLVMIRPEMVPLAKRMILKENSKLDIGTVIDFPKGASVCNYEAFKKGKINLVKEEILKCTQLGIQNHKVVKWIIEVAALNNQQIIQLSALIKNLVISNFKEEHYTSVFVKSSTGFYKTENNLPNGATIPSIIMMLENASPLPVKAAGGVRNYKEAMEMVCLGVKRIGTSSAKAIANGTIAEDNY